MPKRLRSNFFRCESELARKVDLTPFAGKPHPKDTSRTLLLGEIPVLMRNCFKLTDGAFLLDFTRIRNVPSQPISDVAGNEDTLDFSKGSLRPAEYTAAVFDPLTRVLVVDDHAYGVTAGMIGRYLSELHGLARLRFDPVLNQLAMQRLLSADEFVKFSVKLAGMGETTLQTYDLNTTDAMDLIRKYDAPELSLVLKSSKRNGYLSRVKVRELVEALVGLPRKHIKMLSVVADEDGVELPINFLKDRIWHDEALTPEESAEVTHEIRYRSVRNAWDKHRSDLRARYKAESSAGV